MDNFRKLHKASFMGKCMNVQLSQTKIQKLFVGNIPFETEADDIKSLFESYGCKVNHRLRPIGI